MKKTLFFVLGVTVVGFGVHAYAANVNVVGNVITGAQASSGVGAQVDATTSAAEQNLLNANVNVGVNGTNASGTNNGGLQADVQSGAVVNLQSADTATIATNGDLTAYDGLVVKARPIVTGISQQNDGSVAITYAEPAKFLGIFPTTISNEVNVDANGNTTVHSPWWGFLYAKNDSAVQISAAAAVQQSGVQFGAQTNATTTLQNQARVINAVSAAVQAQVSANGSVNAQ